MTTLPEEATAEPGQPVRAGQGRLLTTHALVFFSLLLRQSHSSVAFLYELRKICVQDPLLTHDIHE